MSYNANAHEVDKPMRESAYVVIDRMYDEMRNRMSSLEKEIAHHEDILTGLQREHSAFLRALDSVYNKEKQSSEVSA